MAGKNGRDALARAAQAHAADDLEAAGRAYDEILSKDPENAPALHGLALVMLDGGLLDEALDLALQASRRSPGDAFYHNSLGLVLNARGDYDHAALAFEQAVALNPNFGDAWGNLGIARGAGGDHAAAAIAFGRAAAILHTAWIEAARGDALRLLGESELARSAYEAALGIDVDCVEARIGLALLFLARAEPGRAETELRQALESDGSNALLWSILGNALLAQARPREAIDAYRRSLESEPDHAGTNANLGAALLALGQAEEARDACLTALRCLPEHAEAHFWLAHALLGLGRRTDAARHAARALDLKPALENDPAMTPLRDLMF